MIKLDIRITGLQPIRDEFEALPWKVRMAMREKLKELTESLRLKVVANVSGLILQKRTGALADSIVGTINTRYDVAEGIVSVRPANDKAFALEFGGKGNYQIVPIDKRSLMFFWNKMGRKVFFMQVNHPPSKEFSYLREALADMEPEVDQGFMEVIDRIIGLA